MEFLKRNELDHQYPLTTFNLFLYKIAFDRKDTFNILITAPSLARANLPGYRGRRAQRRDRRQPRPRQGHDSNEKRIGVIVGFKSHYSFSCDILHLEKVHVTE